MFIDTDRRILLALAAVGVVAPFIFPGITIQIAVFWLMVLFALTWDMMGGQMGYNSLGNVLFFGVGMYASVIVQVAMFTDVATYASAQGGEKLIFTDAQYYWGLGLGIIAAGFGAMLVAAAFGWTLFGLRGPYFAIGSLGLVLTAAELAGTWSYIGAGGGLAVPVFPGSADAKAMVFYFLIFGMAILTFLFCRWLYQTRFGLAMNAIRDDELKAEAMGIHCLRYKTITWSTSAFFLGISGAVFGNITGFVEPLEIAFPTVTFGIFMVAMPLLGGKGTLWGPVLGAILFHLLKEVTWTYFLGWQFIALGVLIVVNIVFFQQGIMGWLMEKFPERFGIVVEKKEAAE
ncbi:MAG: branched-chain amino acid ABC transporter permease [Rhodospirillaceae bacterium]